MKTKQLFITLAAAALCLSGILSVSGCKKENEFTPESQKYTVKLNVQKDTVDVGKTIELTATVSPSEGANAVWKSGDEKIAKVTGSALKGTVTGVAEGETYIYCTVNEKFCDSCKVTVLRATIDLSANGTSNCYIVSKAGDYKFKATVKGTCKDSVIAPSAVSVLWESLGTDKAPTAGDLVKDVTLSSDGYVKFTASEKKGNAVIAVTDGTNVLWSWHIWLTDQPSEQVYKNSAGTMMDRNLGATSATPGEVGALGLFYQWGRKDPLLGANGITSSTQAASTLEWPSAEPASSHLSGNNTLSYSISNPTTLITTEEDLCDWYCTDATYLNDNLWKNTTGSAKTIYDPCPVGWRVPDGGKKSNGGVWAKAFNNDDKFTESVFANGFDFGTTDKKLVGDGSDQCWYPAAGYDWACSLNNVGSYGEYWSCTPCSSDAYSLYFTSYNNSVTPSSYEGRAYGLSVRCLKEK